MRENRTYCSEGGEGPHPFPTPIKQWRKGQISKRYAFAAAPLKRAVFSSAE